MSTPSEPPQDLSKLTDDALFARLRDVMIQEQPDDDGHNTDRANIEEAIRRLRASPQPVPERERAALSYAKAFAEYYLDSEATTANCDTMAKSLLYKLRSTPPVLPVCAPSDAGKAGNLGDDIVRHIESMSNEDLDKLLEAPPPSVRAPMKAGVEEWDYCTYDAGNSQLISQGWEQYRTCGNNATYRKKKSAPLVPPNSADARRAQSISMLPA